MTARVGTKIAEVEFVQTAEVRKKQIILSATVTTNDTVPIPWVTAVASAFVVKVSDRSICTNTVAANVVTITQAALADVPVIITALET